MMKVENVTSRKPVRGVGCVVVEDIDDNGADNDQGTYCKGSLTTLQYSYPLKLMVPSRASWTNCKWIYPVTFGGGLVGGDGIDINLHVKRNCCALLTAQESTKVYHCEDNLVSSQTLQGVVEPGAFLCVLTDPVVCYKDSNFIQNQVFRMSSRGNLVYLDWLLAGRVALEEIWLMDSFKNRTDVYIDDSLVYRDHYQLSDTASIPIAKALEPFQVMGSCIILGSKLEEISRNLTAILGKKKDIGERYDPRLTCSVTPLSYTVNESTVTGVYIRFLADSSMKAYEGVVGHIAAELTSVLGGNPFADKYG